MYIDDFDIIDISQSVCESTACFPGDVPWSKVMTLTHADSKVINLTAITSSPHVGTHADAPSHICGDMSDVKQHAGAMPLEPYVGPATVLDLRPLDQGEITDEVIKNAQRGALNPRVLFRTQTEIREDIFKSDYAYIGVSAVAYLASQGARLVGLDTPSVDHINSKNLATHHALQEHNFCWLENLNLEKAEAGNYFLVAAPLKLTTAEAAPVRALLLRTR